MKRILYIGFALFFTVAVSGCVKVNEEYDFANLDTENITIGDEFIAPIGKITTTIEDMKSGNITINPQGAVEATSSTVVTFEMNYPISGGIDQSIIDMLTAQGELYLLIDVENYTPIFFESNIEFLGADEEVVCSPFESVQIAEGSNTDASKNRIEVDITAEDLQAISSASSVSIYYKTNLISYTPTAEDKLVITLKTRKSGGLSLNF